MAKKDDAAAQAKGAPEESSQPENLGTLTEQPTVKRDPVRTELPDGTVRVSY